MVDILVRNVSPERHRALKIEAARMGTTLANYVRILLETRMGVHGAPFDDAAVENLRKQRAALPDMPPIDLSDLGWRASRELDERDGAHLDTLPPQRPAPAKSA